MEGSQKSKDSKTRSVVQDDLQFGGRVSGERVAVNNSACGAPHSHCHDDDPPARKSPDGQVADPLILM
jgi:hypothetical protein